MAGLRRRPGVLGVHYEEYRAWLEARGYTPLTVRNLLKELGQVGRWLPVAGLDIAELSPANLEFFRIHRRQAGYRKVPGSRGLGLLLHRDFLPQFIDAQRALTTGIQHRTLPCGRQPTCEPVRRRGLVDSGTQDAGRDEGVRVRRLHFLRSPQLRLRDARAPGDPRVWPGERAPTCGAPPCRPGASRSRPRK